MFEYKNHNRLKIIVKFNKQIRQNINPFQKPTSKRTKNVININVCKTSLAIAKSELLQPKKKFFYDMN